MKKGWKIFIMVFLSIIILLLIIGGIFAYVFLIEPKVVKNSGGGGGGNSGGKSGGNTNPVIGLTDKEAVAKFNEEFVLYILKGIKAYNLHNPPFSGDTPKIEFVIDNDYYNAEIVSGNINVKKGSIGNEDIRITTTKLEGVKMIRDKKYIETSFNNGNSGFVLVASKVKLFSKGYLDLYEELTGKKAI